MEFQDKTYGGEHEAIVDADAFERVQKLLDRNAHGGGSAVRNKHGGLLRGLLWCAACDAALTPICAKRGKRRYTYYVCAVARQHEAMKCRTSCMKRLRQAPTTHSCSWPLPSFIPATGRETSHVPSSIPSSARDRTE